MGTVLLQKSLPKMKCPLAIKILLINKSEEEREVKTNNFSVYLSTYPKSQSIMGKRSTYTFNSLPITHGI